MSGQSDVEELSWLISLVTRLWTVEICYECAGCVHDIWKWDLFWPFSQHQVLVASYRTPRVDERSFCGFSYSLGMQNLSVTESREVEYQLLSTSTLKRRGMIGIWNPSRLLFRSVANSSLMTKDFIDDHGERQLEFWTPISFAQCNHPALKDRR